MNYQDLRKNFPMLNNKKMQGHDLVYFDNASTTFKPQCVIDEMNKYYTEMNANSHRGDYDLCFNMDQEVLKAREAISKFVQCETNEVVFTSGDTMSMNMIAWGYGFKNLKKDDEIILSESEHASNLLPWFKIAELTGAKIKYVELDNGKITCSNLRKIISSKTKIVSLAHVGNVLGYEIDIKEMTKIIHENGAIFVVDGAQSVPHIETNFRDWDIDFLVFSGHKMLGPTGIGCLIGKYDLLENMDPLMMGGGDNAKFFACGTVEYLPAPAKFESGTLNLSGIMGLRKAVEYLSAIGMKNIEAREKELISYLKEQLSSNKDIEIYNLDATSAILTFNMKGIFAQDEATLLNSKGIAVRSGQHCAKILNDYLKTPATCRASLYFYNTKEEIDYFVKTLNEKGDILDAYFND